MAREINGGDIDKDGRNDLVLFSAYEKDLGWLSQDAWVIVQIHPVEYESLNLQHLVEFDQRKYGSTTLVFFRPDIFTSS